MSLLDRVGFTTTTTGTGAVAIGAAIRSTTNGDYLTPAEAGAVNGTAYSYLIVNGDGSGKTELGSGVYSSTSGGSLARDASAKVWNGTALATGNMTLAGTSKVYLVARAADLGSAPWTLAGSVTANNTSQFITFLGLGTAFQDLQLEYRNLAGASAAYTSLQLSGDNGTTWSTSINIGFTNGPAAYHTGKFELLNARGNVHTPTGYANGSSAVMADKGAVTLGPANYQFGTIRLDGGFNAARIGNPGAVNWASGTVNAYVRN